MHACRRAHKHRGDHRRGQTAERRFAGLIGDRNMMQVVSRVLLLLLGLSTLLHATRDVTRKQQSQPKGRRVKLALDRSAWPEISGRTGLSLANTSLSPWTYTESSDVSRLPRWIYNAECLTSGCLSLQGDGEDASLEAKPIYYQTLVLHRVPKQRKANKKQARRSRVKYEFRLRTEMVSVGCTCVRPTVVPQE